LEEFKLVFGIDNHRPKSCYSLLKFVFLCEVVWFASIALGFFVSFYPFKPLQKLVLENSTEKKELILSAETQVSLFVCLCFWNNCFLS